MLLKDAARQLAQANSPTPRLDSEVLLAHTLGLDRFDLLLDQAATVTAEKSQVFQAMLAKRLAGSPIAYLTGSAEFWSLDFSVTPDVLIPRPDSEILVQAALDLVPTNAFFSFADLGTGSGCLAISILSECPKAIGFAIDSSADALSVARTNAARMPDVEERLTFIQMDMGEWLKQAQRLDLILSNPPYVVSETILELDVSVSRFEPRRALDGGLDGLDFYRVIASISDKALAPHGRLALEVGFDQADAVSSLLAPSFGQINVHQDIAGRDRVITARLKE